MLYTNDEITTVLDESELLYLLPEEVLAEVKRRYNEDHRHYHDFDHAISVLSWVNHCCERFDDSALHPYTRLELRLAALFHDVVYNIAQGSPLNEADSAKVMEDLLTPVIPKESIDRVSKLIMLTAQHGKLESKDVLLAEGFMLDCDIANMAEDRWEIFRWNNLNVVAELEQKYTYEELAVGRRAFLEGMLAKRSIYMTAYFRQQFETKARENLRRMVESL